MEFWVMTFMLVCASEASQMAQICTWLGSRGLELPEICACGQYNGVLEVGQTSQDSGLSLVISHAFLLWDGSKEILHLVSFAFSAFRGKSNIDPLIKKYEPHWLCVL
jgi:hypothetical protein